MPRKSEAREMLVGVPKVVSSPPASDSVVVVEDGTRLAGVAFVDVGVTVVFARVVALLVVVVVVFVLVVVVMVRVDTVHWQGILRNISLH